MNFTGRNASHEKDFFHLLKSTEKYLDEIKSIEATSNTISFELPKFSQYWKSRGLESFLQKYGMTHQSECHACAMGLEAQSGLKVGKVFGIQISDQILSRRLCNRFVCKCVDEHAPFNNVDYHATERYSLKFARFLVRTWSSVTNLCQGDPCGRWRGLLVLVRS